MIGPRYTVSPRHCSMVLLLFLCHAGPKASVVAAGCGVAAGCDVAASVVTAGCDVAAPEAASQSINEAPSGVVEPLFSMMSFDPALQKLPKFNPPSPTHMWSAAVPRKQLKGGKVNLQFPSVPAGQPVQH